MSNSSELIKSGLHTTQAGAIAGSIQGGLTAAGSNQATALALSSVNNVVTTAAASTGVVLPLVHAGDTITVVNLGANALSVYPPVAGKIQSGAANAAFSVAVGKTGVFTAYDNAGSFFAITG